MKYLLSCQHTGHAIDLTLLAETMICPVCGTRRKLVAVECREHKFRCQLCRYSRFTGQSEDVMRYLYRAHRLKTGHDSPQFDYLRVAAKKKQVQEMFGPRRVKTVIVSTQSIMFNP